MNPNNQKYEITDIAHPEYPFLHRIRALRDIGPTVKAGDLGGFVEGECNLSYEDADSWIAHDAIAANGAFVTDGTLMSGSFTNRPPLTMTPCGKRPLDIWMYTEAGQWSGSGRLPPLPCPARGVPAHPVRRSMSDRRDIR